MDDFKELEKLPGRYRLTSFRAWQPPNKSGNLLVASSEWPRKVGNKRDERGRANDGNGYSQYIEPEGPHWIARIEARDRKGSN